MIKKWNYEEYERAMSAAWNAFSNTLLTHGMTKKELSYFHNIIEDGCIYSAVDDAFREVITWEEG